jgi:CubicO group peptidase (beta-lactamase class C family)
MKLTHFYFIYLLLVLSACTHSNSKNTVEKLPIPTMAMPANDSVFNPTLTAQEKQLQLSIDTFYTKAYLRGAYNGSVLITKNNKVLYNKAFGVANKKENRALKPTTSFELASVSKQFTAIAILKLYEQGKLNLGDSVGKYISNFPYKGVLLLDLLNHRSGLPNYTNFCADYIKVRDTLLSNSAVVQLMCTNKPLPQGKPNGRFTYCNTNYVVLARIVELASGLDFPTYMHQQIFAPLGMRNSYIKNKHNAFAANEAVGYNTRYTVYGIDMHDGAYGDKGVFSSVQDMYVWDNMLRGNAFLKQTTLQKAFTPYSFERDGKRNYGLGFRMTLNDAKQPELIYHNGWWHGYRTLFYKNLPNDIMIVSLQNTTGKFVYNIKPIVALLSTGATTNTQDLDE